MTDVQTNSIIGLSQDRKKFPGQKAGEIVNLLVRKHWIMDVKVAGILFLIGFLPLVLGIIIGDVIWVETGSRTFWGFMIFFSLYLLFMLLIAYVKWLNEELDIIIATDQRIISHEQIDLFHRQISETSIQQLQDVKGTENGLFASLFHYGTLEIQTASSDVFFRMKHVDHPYENARKLLDIRAASII
ncbi:MAG: hypothetical protein WC846_03635 [Candidatus Gracilibacteria bacterium]|jgi:hypothetical protein